LAEINRRKRIITNILYWALIAAIVFAAFKYLFGLLWPFLLAFLFSWLLRPVLRHMTLRWHIRYNLAAVLCLLVFFLLVGGLLCLLVIKLTTTGLELLGAIPEVYMSTVEPNLRQLLAAFEAFATRLSPEVYGALDAVMPDLISSLTAAVGNVSMNAVTAVTGFAASLPKRLLSALICLIATIFMTLDFPHISAFVLRQVPEKTRKLVSKTLESLKEVVGRYGKGYLILMGITFGEILAGLWLLRQPRALLLAFLIALFDLFPVVGAGLILLPWAVVTLVGGAFAKGLGLLALWIIVIVLRQIIEPRIVGRSVGLHPLVTLMSMFVGARLFGGIGLFGLPISCAIVKSLDDGGIIHILKREEPVFVAVEEKNEKSSKTRREGY